MKKWTAAELTLALILALAEDGDSVWAVSATDRTLTRIEEGE